MASERIAILFDIDGTLLVTGGAGAASWRLAFDELYGIPADIGKFTDAGMTDPEVGRKTFEAVLNRKPERKEFTRLLERRLHYLHTTVAESEHYRVLPGVEELLPKLIEGGYLLGLVTGNVEAAAHIKLHRAQLNRFFSFGGYGYGLDRSRRTDEDRAEARIPGLRRTGAGRASDRGRRHTPRRGGSTRRRDRLRRRRQRQVHSRPVA